MADGKQGMQEEVPPRRPANERENAFNAAAWLMEGALGFYEELKHNDLGLSPDFWQHAYSARRETLLAARALLDDLLAKMEREERKEQEREERRERRGAVNIEF